jgi:HAE1 family hydrophobic/amphiphilic exporter-1
MELRVRLLALAASAGVFGAPLAPLIASAQTAQPQSSSSPQAQSSSVPQPQTLNSPQAQSSSVPSAQGSSLPQPQTLGQPPAQSSSLPQPQSLGQPAAPGASQPQVSPSGAGLPPPPVPAVLPVVPSFPALSAPLTALPNGDLVGVQQQPFVGVALQDAIAMALQRNTDLAISQSNRRIANYQIVAAKGAFDVVFQLVPSYSHVVTPVITPFNTTAEGGPVTTDTTGATARFTGLTASGGQYSAGISGQHVLSDSAYNSYNPYYETALQFSITQPLLRGRALSQQRLQVELARVGVDYDAADTLLSASNTVVQVEDAYYDLVSAWQNVAIQEEGLRNATAQAQSNARLAAQGAVAPTDIVEANTQVNVFQDNVFSAIQNVQRVQTQLKSLILANAGDPVWFANLVPTTPVAQIPNEPSLDALISSAIENRPEIAELRALRSRANLNLAYARDQLKPQLDVGLGYTTNGFAGDPLDPASNPLFAILGKLLGPGGLSGFPSPPAYQTGSLGTALQNGFDNRFPSYSAQVTFSFPIGNRTARANASIAEEQQRQVQVNETAVLQRVRLEAVNAIQGLREAQYRVIAARAARSASQRVLLGEQRKFAAGTSTTFLVLQRQLEVANAEGRELQAQTDLDKAIVELSRVSGGIFAENGIDVMTAGARTLNAAGLNGVLPSPQPQPGVPGAPNPGPIPRPSPPPVVHP